MNTKSIWSILEESFDILGSNGYPAMDKMASELALEPGWFTLMAAISLFGSEPFSTAQFMGMFPYGLARLNDERFASGARQGYLTSDEQGEYRATEVGENVTRQIIRAADQSIAHLQPMPNEPFQRFVNTLLNLSEESFARPESSARFLLSHKRNLRRIKVTALINHFERYFSELAAYRDDVYIAAWQSHLVEGHAWELFDHLCQGGAFSVDGLFARLKGRGVSPEVYEQDLRELVGYGWVEASSGVYQITLAGKLVRAGVEAETDRLFFTPWLCLDELELEELSVLSTQLRAGLLNVKR